MALVTKNDVTQIFAIQAPEIDLPPTFANYPRGWDAARSNNGKPTIKQFNYIQQRTDQNVLWIHQNGAALPYDAAMEYAEGAVTIKDGRFKQWNGTIWINFGQDDNALKSANNLSDVPNKETARNNLDVYSKIEVDTAISSAIPSDVPSATEIVAGKAKIATTAIAQAGVNDTDFLTPLKLRNALNAAGSAPVYACRAWVNFNGVGVVSVIASGNVSSVTDNGVGDYTLNFATPMLSANYSISSGSTEYSDGTPIISSLRMSGTAPLLKSTSAVRVSTRASSSTAFTDINNISVQVFC